MHKVRIMLTGVSGQVGRSIINSCDSNYCIIPMTRNDLDLTNENQIVRVVKDVRPDIIINPAAYTDVEMAEEQSDEAYLVNSMAPGVMAREANKLGIPLIHFSTDYVFDGTKIEPYKEIDTPNPINVYGKTKLHGEIAIQKQTNLYYIFRTSWVFSSSGKNFFTTMLKLFKKQKELNVINDQYGAPTSSDLIAYKLFLFLNTVLLQKKSKNLYVIYNLTSSGATNWHNYAKQIYKIYDQKNTVDIFPVSSKNYITKSQRPEMSILDNTKLDDIIGKTDDFWEVVLQKEYNKLINS